jgi:hypothetical protein
MVAVSATVRACAVHTLLGATTVPVTAIDGEVHALLLDATTDPATVSVCWADQVLPGIERDEPAAIVIVAAESVAAAPANTVHPPKVRTVVAVMQIEAARLSVVDDWTTAL